MMIITREYISEGEVDQYAIRLQHLERTYFNAMTKDQIEKIFIDHAQDITYPVLCDSDAFILISEKHKKLYGKSYICKWIVPYIYNRARRLETYSEAKTEILGLLNNYLNKYPIFSIDDNLIYKLIGKVCYFGYIREEEKTIHYAPTKDLYIVDLHNPAFYEYIKSIRQFGAERKFEPIDKDKFYTAIAKKIEDVKNDVYLKKERKGFRFTKTERFNFDDFSIFQ